MNTPLPATHTALVEHLSRDLTDRHGPILGGVALARALGYGSLAALRQARRRRQVEVKLVESRAKLSQASRPKLSH
ncbi:hypothetical protein [Aquabacterium sp.]|uniref:hypothetical protein n=1 Tax=Aquabacterium sp. TaxID=1872578 RepID=UPI0035B4BA41